jgi:uroporphyrinogen-III synthase
MTDSLDGARVALLEARRESELASLVRRHGGEPIAVPALREVERDCADEAGRAFDAARLPGAIVVLATGVGLDRWLALARAAGRADEVRASLERATIVCRGPKPVAVLKREGLPVHVRAPAPHTTAELIASLAAVDVADHDVVFVHDGGASRTVPAELARRGAHVVEVQPYAWALPEDRRPLEDLVRRIVAGGVDAVAVTTQIQARHLFEVAGAIGEAERLREALRDRVVVAAVGPTCAKTLQELGAPHHVMPESSKMGALVLALAAHLRAASAAAGPSAP